MTKIYRLQFKDKLKAIDCLRATADRLKQERPTFPEVARELSQYLGVPISPNTAQELVKAAGVEWESRTKRPECNLATLAAAVRELTKRFDHLRGAIINLYENLNLPFHDLESKGD